MRPNNVTDEFMVSPPTSSRLSRAETIPVVTVGASPKVKGCPIATDRSPTNNWSLFPMAIAVRFDAVIFSNPISVNLSEPIIEASYSRPSSNITLTWLEPSITWWLVIMRPSSEITTPEPPPAGIKFPSSVRLPTWTWTIVFVAISAMDTISVVSTLGITSSFSFTVSVIVIGSGMVISSSSNNPNKYRKDKTIVLDKIADPKTMLNEPLFLGDFSSMRSEIYFFCSKSSCCE